MIIIDYIIYFFMLISILSIIGYVVSKDKKIYEILPNKKSSSASSINFIGTGIYGWRKLNAEQLMYYGFEVPYTRNGIMPLANFKTKFISIFVPLIPLRTQVIFNETSGVFDKDFYAIPVKMHWKQVTGILSSSYTGILVFLIIIRVIWFS